MSYVTILAGIAAIHWAALISPGPNFLLITQVSSAESRRAGLCTALGISTGSALWAATAILGVSVIFSRFVWLYTGVRFLGGIYLVYLGIKAWGAAGQPIDPAHALHTAREYWPALRLGFLTHITNPKVTVFYASIFATMLVPGLPNWMRPAAFGIVVVDSIVWHCGLALLFSTRRVQLAYQGAKQWVDRVSGTVMTAFGIHLALG